MNKMLFDIVIQSPKKHILVSINMCNIYLMGPFSILAAIFLNNRIDSNYILNVSDIIIYISHKHPIVNPCAKLLGSIWTPKIPSMIILARSSEG